MSILLIHGGRVISPANGLDGELDILAEDGLVRSIAPRGTLGSPPHGAEAIDASGQIVCPGFIDLHVHFREPGGEESETIETGLAAAVAGGFTSVCPMPNTRPVNDNAALTRMMIDRARQSGLARLFPIAAASIGSEGEELTDFAALKAAGAAGFSDDGRPVKTANLMREALKRARGLGMPVIDHCEEPGLSAGGVVNLGPVAAKLGVAGIPGAAEDVCIARDLVLAAETGARLHIAHLSTADGVEMVRTAKARGVSVTCEVTPHHFTLTEDAVEANGTSAKMNPPLRSDSDRQAILDGLADGSIDAIATDHAPHSPRLKAQPLAAAPFGVTGLETALGLAITQLVAPGRISLARLIELLSVNPARILGLPLGRLSLGSAADITVLNPDEEWTYHAAEGKSKSRNSPFEGWRLKGAVMATVVGGKAVYQRRG
ncbi:MAG: dihydroorotase [Acidobacteriota bacterium]|nr:dihydroorotase [Acidobacteriota bacterium]